MSETKKRFIRESRQKAFDPDHRKVINFNISRYDAAVMRGKQIYHDLEGAKERAAYLKHKTINELEKYLTDFENQFERRGGRVIWAQNAKEAVREITKVLKKHKVNSVVKSKSMITEELQLNDALKKNKIETLETDLGEYIVQLAGEDPYHIVTPAMHKSRKDIAKLFNEKFGLSEDSSPEEITDFVRKKLREEFVQADAGISGANFLVSDIGAVALTENEGNGLMTTGFPRVHIAIAGIEKLIPSMKDLDLFWPLLATHGTGQWVTVYNSLITGPRQQGEIDGPEEMYVVLLDNGRTDILGMKEQRRALSCIKCGACLNVCPVYKNIGGHTYNTTYTGPIGSVISPHLEGMRDFSHLSYASSLCGKCTEVCPVKINLHELLLYNRRDTVKKRFDSAGERFSMKNMKRLMMRRWMMNTGSAGFKNMMLKSFFGKAWGRERKLPEIAPRNFNELWEERRGLKAKQASRKK